jgi:hypothetical protein
MLSGMEQRVKAIANETKLLPPPPPAIVKAIEQGSNVVADAAQKSIEAYKPSSVAPMVRLILLDLSETGIILTDFFLEASS